MDAEFSNWVSKIKRLIRLTTQIRRKRFAFFLELLSSLPRPIRILDVGGTLHFWELLGLPAGDVEITLLNLTLMESAHQRIHAVSGDARSMDEFGPDEFDVVFSNSVIEHVGSFQDQQRAAREIRRVGQRYFVQTPNRWFPLEPHFLFPFFQFFPLSIKVFLLRHFSVGWYPRILDPEAARAVAGSIRLLSRRELEILFPGDYMKEERVLGMVYSFIVYGGWD